MRHSRIALTSVFLFQVLAVFACLGQQPAASNLPKNDLIVPNVNGILVVRGSWMDLRLSKLYKYRDSLKYTDQATECRRRR